VRVLHGNLRLPQGNLLKIATNIFFFSRHFQNSTKWGRAATQLASDATIVLVSTHGMDYDHDKVDEMVLALLWLTAFDEDEFGARAWKSHDWDALDQLHAAGYISDPKSKARSVMLTAEGVRRARELFERNFGREPRRG
jgi:hypothetical protein